MLEGAILGAIGGVIGIIIVFIFRKQKSNNLTKSINMPGVEYSAYFYYASPNRYQKSLKIYDSSGILYLVGTTVYYKTNTNSNPIAFNLNECVLQMEPDWRKLKWFSFTTATGEKYYFDSYKMGAFANDSSETITAFNLFKSKMRSVSPPPPPPPPLN